MKIRRATVDDARLIADLCTHVQEVHIHGRPDIFKTFDMNALINHMMLRLESLDTVAFIGEVDDCAVGYMMLAVVDRSDSVYTQPLQYLEMDQISVHPDFRSHGYGEALTRYAIEFAKSMDISRVTLGVWMFNNDAIRFYERLGFSAYTQKMEIRIGD